MNSSLIYVDSNTVDLAYLAMIFCPEVYKSRCPDTFSAQLCNTMITRTNNPIQTTVDNNYLMYLFTDSACAPGGALNDPFQVTSTSGTGSTCNLGTGAITSPLSGPGVFHSYGAQNIAGFRVTAASIRVIPTLAQYNN